ncbi:MAG TPA: hypothetical protein PKD55_01340 [Bellilinea sp.]|nr:hypothetical protein [Bellilinea sp.]
MDKIDFEVVIDGSINIPADQKAAAIEAIADALQDIASYLGGQFVGLVSLKEESDEEG